MNIPRSFPKPYQELLEAHYRGDGPSPDEDIVGAIAQVLLSADNQIRALTERVDLLLDVVQPGATWGFQPERTTTVAEHQFIRSANGATS